MTIIIVKMTNVTRAWGLDQSIIVQPMALVIDMSIDVSVSPFGRSESLMIRWDISKAWLVA